MQAVGMPVEPGRRLYPSPLPVKMSRMKKASHPPIDLAKADAKLRAWRKKYDTPEKVAALHRKTILNRVVQSMDFEGQPVRIGRLKSLLRQKAKRHNN